MKPLIDWVCVTFKALKNLDDIFAYFFLKKDDFKVSPPRNKYQFGLWYEHISVWYTIHDKYEEQILSPGSEDNWTTYDVCFTFSGQGCRFYETLRGKGFDWVRFIYEIKTGFNPEQTHFARLDVAFDVKDDTVPDMIKIIEYVEKRKYISNFRRVVVGKLSEEWVYFGSPSSDTRLRIYNKALERGFTDGSKWVRFEYQLRNESAERFLFHLSSVVNKATGECSDIGQAFKDFISESVTFTTKPNDTSKNATRDLKPAKWWRDFVKSAGKISCFDTPGIEYNYFSNEKFLNDQCSPSLAAYVDANNGDITPLLDMIEHNKFRMNERQKSMVEHEKRPNKVGEKNEVSADQRAKLEAYYKLRAELFGH